jgi:hypothetical protein
MRDGLRSRQLLLRSPLGLACTLKHLTRAAARTGAPTSSQAALAGSARLQRRPPPHYAVSRLPRTLFRRRTEHNGF